LFDAKKLDIETFFLFFLFLFPTKNVVVDDDGSVFGGSMRNRLQHVISQPVKTIPTLFESLFNQSFYPTRKAHDKTAR